MAGEEPILLLLQEIQALILHLKGIFCLALNVLLFSYMIYNLLAIRMKVMRHVTFVVCKYY